jgi:tetraacyldisaccharide 4'-kinase
VVSVGNLTLGGTGKTPLVKWLARWACSRAIRPAIVSRGYGAAAGAPNDEGRELGQALPTVPHVQNPDRVAAARLAIAKFAAEMILLDDGFQHRRLARDLDIVLLDALEPFGFEHVFPRGLLREPPAGLARADVVVLSRSDLVKPFQRAGIRQRVVLLAPDALWCEVKHAPASLINASGQIEALDSLRDRRVAAFCGLGNPAGFRRTLESTGCQIVAWREFPDHHAYSPADHNAIQSLATAAAAQMVVCTHKDLVKLEPGSLGSLPLWALSVEIQFLVGEQQLERELSRIAKR